MTEYDWLYKSNKKKVDAKPKALYLSDNQKWRVCSWNTDSIQSNVLMNKIKNTHLCQTGYKEYFKSENGFEWTQVDIDFSTDKILKLENFNIFVSSNSLYLSTDLDDFKEMILADGNWEKISLNSEKILTLHAPSIHEKYLIFGQFICI